MTTDSTQNQRRLAQALTQFKAEYQYGAALVDYLRRDNVGIFAALKERDKGRWKLLITLPALLKEMFDIQLDVVLLATPFTKLEPRILTDIHSLARAPRVDNEIAVLVSLDNRAGDMVRQKKGTTAVLALDGTTLANSNSPTFKQALATALLTVDHFNVTRPIHEESAFFGRERDVDELRSSAREFQHVGLFALPKTGKSSLLNRLSRRLKDEDWNVVTADLNEFQGDAHSLEQHILKEVGASEGTKSWTARLDTALDAQSAPVAIVIDEIDAALAGRSFVAGDDGSRLVQTLSQLRSVCQRRQLEEKPFPVIITAGVDSSIFEQSHLGGRVNPLYQFARLYFLELLSRDDLSKMIRALGKRTGIRFGSHTLIDELFAEYGGHPLLTRQACSFIHRSRPAGEVPYHVRAEDLERAFSATGPNTPRHYALQIPNSFAHSFPAEADALLPYLRGETTALSTEIVSHALPYGILTTSGQIRIRAIERALRGTL
jgi:hypothetical protein